MTNNAERAVSFQVHDRPSSQAISREVANTIAELIRDRNNRGKQTVLGLATGSSPVGIYAELVRLHNEEGLSFKNVITFNLDEYYPMAPDELQSYVHFMWDHLFHHIDIPAENVHIPDGSISPAEVPAYCRDYEEKIAQAGGIDIQLLGIGRTGHIGFNEPGSSLETKTRLITLDRITRTDAASDFFGLSNVPRQAITMGVGSVMSAKHLIIVAFGENKAPIVAKAVEGPITPTVPATFLRQHSRVDFYVDEAAAAELARKKTPWLDASVDWTPTAVRKAVIWLSRELGKAILKLQDEDYNEHGLQELLAEQGPAYNINLKVFRELQATITGWPGGKRPDQHQPGDRRRRFEDIYPKRVIVFSPHPDDDVISMGGTLTRLADHGHEVHVAYQTSGNIAVFDDDARRYADFVGDFCRAFDIKADQITSLSERILQSMRNKQPGEVDSKEMQTLKGLIRREEAKAGARACGVPDERLHYLDLPFYETGKVKKKPLGGDDIRITVDLLRKIQPHQIYAAGDLSDPHGTHRTCLAAIQRAWDECQSDEWSNKCEFWLYRGAWQEWAPHEIEMAVPLSPDEVERKREAIFKHESQKDRALFPGADQREFWQRAEQRNADTARIYDQLGLAEYAAIEGFVRWSEQLTA
ncbi:glucosamine-6-phosphate deaminase [Calycomorphotria hydatis]